MRLKAKRFPQGSSSGRGSRLRLGLLLATVAAFLLVPAAQAAANGTLEVKITGTGSGSGEVSSVGGYEGSGLYEGTPPIQCSGPPATNVCNDTLSEEPVEFPGTEGVALHAIAAPGSKLAGWEVEGQDYAFQCHGEAEPEKEPKCFPVSFSGGNILVKANFVPAFPLKLEKIGNGEGTVVSSPAGINCGPACTPTETASFETGKEVILTASPAEGSVFTSWTGCSLGAEGHKCKVGMSVARTVKAKFTKVQPVTAVKDPTSTGQGTLSSSPSGIVCSPSCTSATALFTEGGASFVKIKAAPLTSTSEFDSWTSCPGTVEGGTTCKVAMSEAQTVEAKFKAIPQNALKLTKAGAGTGTVSSSPAGISCGQNCPSAEASYLQTKEVTLKEIPSKGSAFVEWSGACSGTGECKVKMSEERNVTAAFE